MRSPYVHNPSIFRAHYSGRGMPVFKGARRQRGHGAFLNALKRVAMPLLLSGTKAAAPHISKAVSNVTSKAVGRAFPQNAAMQEFAGRIAGQAFDAAARRAGQSIQKKENKKKVRRSRVKAGASTTKDIFK